VSTKRYLLNYWYNRYLLLRRRYRRRLPDREERTHSTSTEEHNTSEGTGCCEQSWGVPNETQRRTPTSL